MPSYFLISECSVIREKPRMQPMSVNIIHRTSLLICADKTCISVTVHWQTDGSTPNITKKDDSEIVYKVHSKANTLQTMHNIKQCNPMLIRF